MGRLPQRICLSHRSPPYTRDSGRPPFAPVWGLVCTGVPFYFFCWSCLSSDTLFTIDLCPHIPMNPQWSLDFAGMKHMPVPRLGSLTAPVPRRATDTRKPMWKHSSGQQFGKCSQENSLLMMTIALVLVGANWKKQFYKR